MNDFWSVTAALATAILMSIAYWLRFGRTPPPASRSTGMAPDVHPPGAMQDGAVRIPCEGTEHEIAGWIWRNLVPKSGESGTVQGELLRSVERLRWEAQVNGNINWSDVFEEFIDYLYEHLVECPALPDETRCGLIADLGRLRNFLPVDRLEHRGQDHLLPCVEDALYDRLVAGVVAFSRLYPVPIPREPDPTQHH
jgi:hypothetical protein